MIRHCIMHILFPLKSGLQRPEPQPHDGCTTILKLCTLIDYMSDYMLDTMMLPCLATSSAHAPRIHASAFFLRSSSNASRPSLFSSNRYIGKSSNTLRLTNSGKGR